jgi:peptide/nickel transport system substrate-binding protein
MLLRMNLVVVGVLMLTACAPGSPSPQGETVQGQTAEPPKTLVAGMNEDPKNMWDGINGGGGSGARQLGHMVNQYLAVVDSNGAVHPRLLAELPSIEKGTWKVLPDRTMEVTYKVRPGVTWHDGTPFTADDIAFSYVVGRDSDIPNGNRSALRLITDVVATDTQTAVMTYSQTYAFADRLEHREFYPLPKHLVDRIYQENKETFAGQPYFSTEYVGTGPFKMSAWQHGSHLEMVANDSYFLGRPNIDRVRVMFIDDANTAVANLRADTLNIFLPTGGPDYDDLLPLKADLLASGKGDVVIERARWQFLEPQKRDTAQPSDLRDVRFRQALLMSLNREVLSQSLQGDQWAVAHNWLHPSFANYVQLKDVMVEVPYDTRRALELFGELGWTRSSDGILQKNGQRLTMQIRPGEAREREAAIMQQDWKNVGIDGSLEVLSDALLRDAEARANFTGVAVNQNPMGGVSAVRRFASDQIPAAQNRWAGTNRGAYSNAAWDDAGQRLRTALDDQNRLTAERDLLRVFHSDLPALATQYELQAVAVVGFKGIVPITGFAHTGNIMHTWNVHEWEMTR